MDSYYTWRNCSYFIPATWVVATGDITGLQEGASALFTAVTQGVLAAGTSVYVNQLYVQANKEE